MIEPLEEDKYVLAESQRDRTVAGHHVLRYSTPFPITIFGTKSASQPSGAADAHVPAGLVSSAPNLIAKANSTMRQSLR